METDTNGVYSYIQESTRNEEFIVGNTSKTLSDSRNQINPRKVIVIRNTSTVASDVVTVNLGYTPATAGAGIVLRQNEAFCDSGEKDYFSYQGVITIIGNSATCKVSVYER